MSATLESTLVVIALVATITFVGGLGVYFAVLYRVRLTYVAIWIIFWMLIGSGVLTALMQIYRLQP